jgi:SAM-dependent methyltransferase
LRLIYPTYSKFIFEGEVVCEACGTIYLIKYGILDLMAAGVPADNDSRHEMELREGEHPILRGAAGTTLSWRDVAEIESTMKLVGNPSNKMVLELGCGSGAYTRRLLSASAVLAIDFSMGALRRNQARLPVEAPVGLVRADVATLLCAPNAFDLALTTLYSNLPTSALRRACNQAVLTALRPGGRYIVSAHHQGQRRVWKGLPTTGYYSEGGIFFQCFSGQTLGAELDEFEIDAMDPVCIEIPLVSRLPSDRLRAWVAQRAARFPRVSGFGSVLLASGRKPVK